MLIDHFPLLGLCLRTPRLELRLPGPEELAELADLAARGIHDPEVMPFAVAWTDQPPAERARSVVRFRWATLGALRAEDWAVPLTVFRGGTVVGHQTVAARDFAVTREVRTGSWLGRVYQGQGIGTEMRTAVLHLAFAGLGALEALSGAFTDNGASLGVSRKLGYRLDGIERRVVRGALAVNHRLRLTRQEWAEHGPVPVTIEGLEPCLAELGAVPVAVAG
jgi:RimJ/RimL family protein N-acetyltransferase